MDLHNSKLYFFTVEAVWPNMPVECRFIRWLENEKGREVILIRIQDKIAHHTTSHLILTPKYSESKFLNDDPIMCYVMNGKDYVDKYQIDLSGPAVRIINWGGLTNSFDDAKKIQVE